MGNHGEGRTGGPGSAWDPQLSMELTASLGGESVEDEAPAATPGSVISTYRINRLLGRGGMGLVYEAEQRSPQRLVALKVMRQGHRVDEIHAQLFHHEAQTLARLRHPNIASIYESGHTEQGHDFFAMELVEGSSLDAWLAQRVQHDSKAAIRSRLRLFQSICKPVHYAHQRGVIHRDLKPKNIMIVQDSSFQRPAGAAGTPVVKILDFGLAHITDATLPSTPDLHDTGTIRGTVPYMSPEQACGDISSIDVRADIYALGVILYEMLTGKRPYSFSSNSLRAAVNTICEAEPEPMWEFGAKHRPVDRELQTIVLKALAKDPDQRYESVAIFADDLERYSKSQPIDAFSSTRAYRARKFISRHRFGFAASLVLTVALVAGIAGTSIGLVRARKAEAVARREAITSLRVSSFLADILSGVDAQRVGEVLVSELEHRVAAAAADYSSVPGAAEVAVSTLRSAIRQVSATDAGRIVLDKAILSPAGETIGKRFEDEPEVAGHLEHTLAETYERLGLYEQGLVHAERAAKIRSVNLGPRSSETLRTKTLVATLRYRQGDFDGAERELAATHDDQIELLGEDHPDTLQTALSRAWVMIEKGQLAAAAELLETTLAHQQRELGANHRSTISTMNSLAVVLTGQNRYAEAEVMHRTVLELQSSILDAHDPDTLKSMTNLAVVSFYQGRLDDAADLFAEVLEIQREMLGPTHPTTLGSANNLAILLERQERFAEAEELHSWALQEKRRVLGPEHPETLSSLYNLAIVHTAQDRLHDAADEHAAIFEARSRLLGPEHPQTLNSLSAMAGVAALQGEKRQALAWLERAVESGYSEAESMMTDSDFESLRDDVRFLQLVERAGSVAH